MYAACIICMAYNTRAICGLAVWPLPEFGIAELPTGKVTDVIKRVHTKNFKALRDVEVDLTPLHVLIGPNDSGKSSILQALAAIVHSTNHSLPQCFPGPWDGRDLVCNQNRDGTIELGVTVPVSDEDAVYKITCEFPQQGREVCYRSEWVSGLADGPISLIHQHPNDHSFLRSTVLSPQPDAPEGVEYDDIEKLRGAICGVHEFRWYPPFLALPTALDSKWKFRLQPSGFGLPRLLDEILGYDLTRFIDLECRFTEIFPEFNSISIRPQRAYHSEDIVGLGVPRLAKREGKGIFFKMKEKGKSLPASQVSDGVLLVLAYLAILNSPEPPGLLLIEEPENGIHPERLKLVIAILRELLVYEQQHTQIVMTTHSPYLVDLLEPEEVTLCYKGKDGAIQTRSLSTVPAVKQQLDVFNLGEIWTGEGDEALAADHDAGSESS